MKKHKLLVMGWIGDMSCYLDIERDEAIRRFKEENKEFLSEEWLICSDELFMEKIGAEIIEFDDEFKAYQIFT